MSEQRVRDGLTSDLPSPGSLDINQTGGLPSVPGTYTTPHAVEADAFPMPPDMELPMLPHDHPSFGVGTSLDLGPTRHFQSQGSLHSYHLRQAYAAPQHSTAQSSSNDMSPSGYRRSYPLAGHHMSSHDPEMDEDDQSASHGSPAQQAGASIGAHLPNEDDTASERAVLRFNSFAHATEMREKIFRMPMKPIKGDDVKQVERDKRKHVLSLVEALKHKDFVPEPVDIILITKVTKRRKVAKDTNNANKNVSKSRVPVSEDEKKALWQDWQKNGQQEVEAHLSQPNADGILELRAWEVYEEIIRTHRKGPRFTNQRKDETLKCSERVKEALQVIKDYARVRVKVIKGHKISDLAIYPQAYAKVTIDSHKNNSTRPAKKAGDANKSKSRTAKKDGTVARRYQPKEDNRSTKKKQTPVARTGSSLNQPTNIVSNKGNAKGLPSEDGEDEGDDEDEDGDEDEDEDAEEGDVDTNGEDEEQDEDEAEDEEEENDEPETVTESRFDTRDLGENPFDHVPGNLHSHGLAHDDNTYPQYFNNTSMSMPAFAPPTQASTPGLGMPGPFGLPAQFFPMPTASGLMLPVNHYVNTMAMGPAYTQQSVNPPHGLPSMTEPTSSHFSDITNQGMAGLPGNLPRDQAPQGELPKARTNKRRKL